MAGALEGGATRREGSSAARMADGGAPRSARAPRGTLPGHDRVPGRRRVMSVEGAAYLEAHVRDAGGGGRGADDSPRMWTDVMHACVSLAGIGLVTVVCYSSRHLTNVATVALSYLLLVLFVATFSNLWIAVSTSVAAALTFNFFFLPPVGTFLIADPQNLVTFVAFVTVSLVASHLSSVAQTREHELARLFRFSRD